MSLYIPILNPKSKIQCILSTTLYLKKFGNTIIDIFLSKEVLNSPTFTRNFEEEKIVLYILRCIVVEKYLF
jgi:hypothetical protein